MGRNKKKAEVKPATAPQRVRGFSVAFLVLCTAGLLLSADLMRLHVNVHTDPEYQSYCAMSERVNCETVAASDHSILLGLPLALWGILAYLLMGALAVWSLRTKQVSSSWPFGLLVLFSGAAALFGLYLGWLSHFVIESVCLVCLGTYLVNFLLFGIALSELRRVKAVPLQALSGDLASIRRSPKPFLILIGVVTLPLLLAAAFIPRYWQVQITTGPGGLSAGVTDEGHPWIGATQPKLEIIEYSDYQCPYCQRGHGEMRQLLTSRPDEVRLIHRHYPLDQNCNGTMRRQLHEHACLYAAMAHCAGEQQRFWEANDYLYIRGRDPNPVANKELADAVALDVGELERCVASPETARAIAEDLAAGRKQNVGGTPTFIVLGKAYPGRIPPDVLAAALE